MTGFNGFPLGAIDFYEDLERENSREWWLENKARYDEGVRAPMEAFASLVEEEFGTAKIFRPNRDVRFSADKSPYKTHQGLVVAQGEGAGWYVQVSAEGMMTAGGWWRGTTELVARYREALDDEDRAEELQRIVADLRGVGFEIGGDRLKSRPRGVEPDHPYLELLRHRSLIATRQHGEPAWLPTKAAADRVLADWRAYKPLMAWVGRNMAWREK